MADEILFEAVDPRGRAVVCGNDRWLFHILGTRPFMREWEDEVREAIEQPLWISQVPDYGNREVYYRRREGRLSYLKVVVEFPKEGPGMVWTAFPTDSGKPGEKMLWPPSGR